MILVDTSIWVDHLRAGHPVLAHLHEQGHVLGHPWAVGEIALGSLKQREYVLALSVGRFRRAAATRIRGCEQIGGIVGHAGSSGGAA